MATYSPRKSSGPILRSPSSYFASATSSAFGASRSLRRPTSPTRVIGFTPSLSFRVDRPVCTTVGKPPAAAAVARQQTCMCSPTNHPGSFRCSLHKSRSPKNNSSGKYQTSSYGNSNRLNMMRSAMKNSLVRIGTVECDLVKRALASLIRPSCHQQRRRGEFRPRPSRLSLVSR